MNIKRAKQEIKDAIEAYLIKDAYGEYCIPSIRQRPILLMGPPGIGKTQIMEQIARECEINLVSYTITHHTRQSAVGLPFIREKEYGGKSHSVTEYTMSEIISSVYDRMEDTQALQRLYTTAIKKRQRMRQRLLSPPQPVRISSQEVFWKPSTVFVQKKMNLPLWTAWQSSQAR